MILHLLDRSETDLPYDRQVTLQDLETGEKLQVDPNDHEARFAAANVASKIFG